MPKDPAQALSSVLQVDSLILGLTIGLFWVGVFVAKRLGLPATYGLEALGLARPKPGYFAAAKLGFMVGVGALALAFVLNPLSASVLERFGVSTKSTI
jgi:hypothetical protein